MTPTAPDLVLPMTVLAVFAGAFVAGVVGFAFSAVAGAILFHWVAPAVAVPIFLVCSIATQLFSIASLWRTVEWRQSARFLLGGLLGIPLGALLLRRLDAATFAAVFGSFLVLYSAFMLLKPDLRVARRGLVADAAAGFAGGVTAGSIAFPGAVPSIWCSLRGLPKQEQRGIVQPFILLMQAATVAYFAKTGMLGASLGSALMLCVPAGLLGTWLGLRLYRRVDDRLFRNLVLTLLLLSGATLIV